MKLRNPSGRIVSVTGQFADYYSSLDGWEKVAEATPKSSDYTIAELRDMKDSIDDWDSFIEGDNRKSVSQI